MMSDRDFSQVRLCKKTGLSKSVISRLLSGEQQPKYDQIKLIATALGACSGDFFHVCKRTQMSPIVTPHSIVRPLHEEATGRFFQYAVHAHADFEILGINENPSHGTYTMHVLEGHLEVNGELLPLGDPKTFTSRRLTKLTVRKGAHYTVSVVAEHPTTMADILSVRVDP
jgi:hypothetical protein